MRKREIFRRWATRLGLGTAAHFGLDAWVLGISCGCALRATVAAFFILERIATWALMRAYEMAVWAIRAVIVMLDWVGASY